MADSTLTTVVVVSCNYGRFLRDAVRSVAEQTTKPRILLVDDASTDETRQVVQQLLTDYSGIEYHPLPSNVGLSRVRNLAAGLATSDWIVYLDADDFLDVSYVSKAEAWLAAHAPVDVLTTDMTIVRPDGLGRVRRARVPRFWDDLLVRNTIVQTSFIRRALIERVGGYDPSLAFEDWDFWIRVLQAGGRIARLPGAHVFWRDHGKNKSKHGDEAQAAASVRRKHRLEGASRNSLHEWR